MLGPYRLGKRIGSGGMASVFEATHATLEKPVALKVLHPHVAAEPKSVARFLREGRAAARIRHPHAVSVFDAGTAADGTPYLVMELERGETLASWLRAFGALGTEQAVDLVVQVLAAIQQAHSLGIIHRDIKPANILMGADHLSRTVPKIADFGISRSRDAGDEHLLTEGRALLGTLAYMAPEQIRAPREVEAAADQYSAGVVLYECLTGRRPFEADNSIELAQAILNAPLRPPRVHQLEIPPVLDAIVVRAMDRDPKRRFATLAAFARALLPFASEHVMFVYARDFAADGLGRGSASSSLSSSPPPSTLTTGETAEDLGDLGASALSRTASGAPGPLSEGRTPRARWKIVASLGSSAVAVLGLVWASRMLPSRSTPQAAAVEPGPVPPAPWGSQVNPPDDLASSVHEVPGLPSAPPTAPASEIAASAPPPPSRAGGQESKRHPRKASAPSQVGAPPSSRAHPEWGDNGAPILE
jgi:serine/threonine-protein kinase